MSAWIAQRDLRNDVSAILRRVADGESFTVTVRGEPVADLIPVRAPRRFVPARRVREIIRDFGADRALLTELRDLDVDNGDTSETS